MEVRCATAVSLNSLCSQVSVQNTFWINQFAGFELTQFKYGMQTGAVLVAFQYTGWQPQADLQHLKLLCIMCIYPFTQCMCTTCMQTLSLQLKWGFVCALNMTAANPWKEIMSMTLSVSEETDCSSSTSHNPTHLHHTYTKTRSAWYRSHSHIHYPAPFFMDLLMQLYHTDGNELLRSHHPFLGYNRYICGKCD